MGTKPEAIAKKLALRASKEAKAFKKSVKRVGRMSIRDLVNFGFTTGMQVQISLVPVSSPVTGSPSAFGGGQDLGVGDPVPKPPKKDKKKTEEKDPSKMSYYMRKKLGLTKGRKGKKSSKKSKKSKSKHDEE